MILPNRIEGETMPVNKDQTISTYSQHNILGDTKKNITNYVSFIKVYFNKLLLNNCSIIIIKMQQMEAVINIKKK